MRVFTDFKSKSKDKRKVVYKPFFCRQSGVSTLTCINYLHALLLFFKRNQRHTHTQKPQQQSNLMQCTCNSPILQVGGTKHSLVTK